MKIRIYLLLLGLICLNSCGGLVPGGPDHVSANMTSEVTYSGSINSIRDITFQISIECDLYDPDNGNDMDPKDYSEMGVRLGYEITCSFKKADGSYVQVYDGMLEKYSPRASNSNTETLTNDESWSSKISILEMSGYNSPADFDSIIKGAVEVEVSSYCKALWSWNVMDQELLLWDEEFQNHDMTIK